MIKICILIVLISYASTGHADFPGSSMLTNCEDALDLANQINVIANQKFVNASICYGYINGAIDALDIGAYKGAKYPFMIPQNVGMEQLIRVYVKYLEQHPEKLHLNSTNLLYMSLEEAFPRIK